METVEYLKEKLKFDIELLKLCSTVFLANTAGLATIFIRHLEINSQFETKGSDTLWVVGFIAEFIIIVFFLVEVIAIKDTLDKLKNLTQDE